MYPYHLFQRARKRRRQKCINTLIDCTAVWELHYRIQKNKYDEFVKECHGVDHESEELMEKCADMKKNYNIIMPELREMLEDYSKLINMYCTD